LYGVGVFIGIEDNSVAYWVALTFYIAAYMRYMKRQYIF